MVADRNDRVPQAHRARRFHRSEKNALSFGRKAEGSDPGLPWTKSRLGVERKAPWTPCVNTVAEAWPTARRATKKRSSPNDGSREDAGDDFLSLFDAHHLADEDSPSAQFIPDFLSITGLRTAKGINRLPARSLHCGKHKRRESSHDQRSR